MPKYLTPREAASILRITTTYCRDLIRKGRIPATKPTGKAILIEESDLMNFIQAGRTSTAPTTPEVK
ncbi:helix-turn-helix domain-containing protein [Candidatus Ozemobacteraceae bacterium]|nr:helix-turn-helix domain-containing protein [Candidatus Ozemobacteraceae bacterium]